MDCFCQFVSGSEFRAFGEDFGSGDAGVGFYFRILSSACFIMF